MNLSPSLLVKNSLGQDGSMPIKYVINALPNTTRFYCSGNLSNEDILESLMHFVSNPYYNPAYDELWDLTAVESTTVSQEGLRRVADFERTERPLGGANRRAVVAPSDLLFGLARMYEMIAEDVSIDIRVFRDTGPACRWLGFDEETE